MQIFAMETDNGSIVWSSYLPDLMPFRRDVTGFAGMPEDLPRPDKGKVMLFLQRTTSHYPHLPLMTAVGISKVSSPLFLTAIFVLS